MITVFFYSAKAKFFHTKDQHLIILSGENFVLVQYIKNEQT